MSATNHTIKVAGDYSAHPCYVGSAFDMKLELTRPYARDGDGAAILDCQLVLHSLALTHNHSGGYSVVVSGPGYADETGTFAPATELDETGEDIFMVRGLASDTTVTITASGPTPCTIVCGEWTATLAMRAF